MIDWSTPQDQIVGERGGTILIKKGSAVAGKKEGCLADKQKLSTTAEGH